MQFCNELKLADDEAYLKYLDQRKNNFNINEMLIELVKWNPDFRCTELFRSKKTKDISKLKNEYFKQGRLLQNGDNLTIMDNPIALLLKAVGADPLQEGCFDVVEDGICWWAVWLKALTSSVRCRPIRFLRAAANTLCKTGVRLF